MKPTLLPFSRKWGCTVIVVFPRATIRGAIGIAEVLIGVRDNAAVDVKQALVQSAQAELSVRESMESTRVTIDALGPVVGEVNTLSPNT